jgi:hypothetical protein
MSRTAKLRTACVASLVAVVASASTARAAAKDDVQAAVKKLADAGSYAWTTRTEGGFGGGTAEGKAEKDGFTVVSMTVFNNDVQLVKKGDKGAVKTEEGWKSFEELSNDPGQEGQPNRGRFMARLMQNYKAPAAVAQDLVAHLKDVKQSGDALEAELTEEGAKSLMTMRGRQGGQGPDISGAKGSAKFWLKDGAVSKIEYRVQGTVSFGGQDRDIDRTSTIEIKDVGTAKVDVPEEAKKKVS